MPRDEELYKEDIENSIKRIEEYTRGLDYEKFESDQKTIDAVIKNLVNIGEAAKNISENNTSYDWSQIAKFRDFIVHQYFKADEEIIWDIIQNELPELKKHL